MVDAAAEVVPVFAHSVGLQHRALGASVFCAGAAFTCYVFNLVAGEAFVVVREGFEELVHRFRCHANIN